MPTPLFGLAGVRPGAGEQGRRGNADCNQFAPRVHCDPRRRDPLRDLFQKAGGRHGGRQVGLATESQSEVRVRNRYRLTPYESAHRRSDGNIRGYAGGFRAGARFVPQHLDFGGVAAVIFPNGPGFNHSSQ